MRFGEIVVAILLVIAVIGLPTLLFIWKRGENSAAVRRRDFHVTKQERDLAEEALEGMVGKADFHRDIDSPLATEIRRINREYQARRREIG